MFVNSLWASFLMLQQGGAKSDVGLDLDSMWHYMGIPGKSVAILLFIVSAWSVKIVVDRALKFSAARKQSQNP